MAQPLGGNGLGLPLPQNLYPSELFNAAQDFSSNRIALAPGDVLVFPAGTWFVGEGAVSLLQYADPVTQAWSGFDSARGQPQYVKSDGVNVRLANLTGCVVAAVIAGGGTGFTSGTATITASAGGSTWLPIVGGALSVTSVTAAGANYTMPPIVAIPDPVPPGVPAAGYATISSGTVSGVTLTQFGAGYTTGLATAVLLPNPADPNFGSITQATVTLGVDASKSGAITAALCTNNGSSITAVTLTAAGGAGSGATITPYILMTATGATVTGAGAGYSGSNEVLSLGGKPTVASVNANPSIELTGFRPRQAVGSLNAPAGVPGNTLTTYDSGLLLEPSGTTSITALLLSTVTPSTVAAVSLLVGGLPDIVTLQPAP